SGALARGARRRDVLEALATQLALAGRIEQIDAHARGVEAHGEPDGVVDEQDERGLAARQRLEQRRLPGGELDRVGPGGDERLDGRSHVLDAGEQVRLAEEAVVHGDVDAAAGDGMEESVEAIGGGHVPVVSRLAAADAVPPSPMLIAGPN